MAQPLTEIVKTNLATQIFESLRERILSGELEHGQPLTIKQISQEYGVSVTPAREALTLLSVEGLVIIVPRTGTFVANLGVCELPKLFEFRMMIETYAMEHGLGSLTDAEATRLAALVDKMRPLIVPRSMEDRTSYLDYDQDLHSSLVRLLHNPRVERSYSELHVHTRIVRAQITVRPRLREVENDAEHSEIVAACAARDAQRASRAVRKHLEAVLATFLEASETPVEPLQALELVRSNHGPEPAPHPAGMVCLEEGQTEFNVKS